jgi:hypothetical protein
MQLFTFREINGMLRSQDAFFVYRCEVLSHAVQNNTILSREGLPQKS